MATVALGVLQATQANAIADLREAHSLALEDALEAVEKETKIRSNQKRSIANQKFAWWLVQIKMARIIVESSIMLEAVQQLIGDHIHNQTPSDLAQLMMS
jgi:hypothetical protein